MVFLIKENRTFDNYFGAYGHGSDGATDGKTAVCHGNPKNCNDDGDTVPLTPGYDMNPHDITHGFASGLYAINGGRMNGYNIIGDGSDLTGYTTMSRDCDISPAKDADAQKEGSGCLPAYWAYADHYVLADHFFTSMYGPTFPEHLYTVAADSFEIVDNKSDTGGEANYCDDPAERTPAFRQDLSKQDKQKIMQLEDHITDEVTDQLVRIFQYTDDIPTCVDIPTLPGSARGEGDLLVATTPRSTTGRTRCRPSTTSGTRRSSAPRTATPRSSTTTSRPTSCRPCHGSSRRSRTTSTRRTGTSASAPARTGPSSTST